MKVGLDAGVIGYELFTMLMIMAITTTLMTTPMMSLYLRHAAAVPDVLAANTEV